MLGKNFFEENFVSKNNCWGRIFFEKKIVRKIFLSEKNLFENIFLLGKDVISGFALRI